MSGLWLMIGGLNGLIAMGAGAYGWHSLGADDAVREIFMMGVGYQMWHALAILATALLATRPEFEGSRLPSLAGIGFTLGTVLFSGTLYAYALLGYVLVEGAAPFGGFLLMAGWLAIIICGYKAVMSPGSNAP